MRKIGCIIVDDEKLAGELLEAYVRRIPELELKGVFQKPLASRTFIAGQQVELLFLDIQMPEISGLEFLKSMKRPPATILTTAYSEYAVESYELDVIDYLVKPIEFDRFYKAVNKAIEKLRPEKADGSPADPIAGEKESDDYIFIKADSKIHKVNFSEILFIESLREYARIHTEGKRIVTRLALSKLEEKLPQHRFFRVHRTYIINLQKVTTIEGNIIRIGNQEITVSKGRREELHALIEKHGLL